MRQPNVLLVTADHWPGSLLGIAGRPVLTPTLDYLARLGTRFPRAYSESPVCIPARRSLMTGTSPRTHGDRQFLPAAPMPSLPTLAQTFRDAGYQTNAVGKLHVYPQRDRIGFDDVVLMEEGRPQLGAVDDYEMYLADQGLAGQQYAHGLSNNDYQYRPWHLAESLHPTNWASQQMARVIKRRDPTRPAFWYLSYSSPHPPLAPLQAYLDLYRDRDIDVPLMGDWAKPAEEAPYALRGIRQQWPEMSSQELADTRKAFYALCTHIDHQLRIVIGTLREEELLDNTIILFTSDHGDMLGDHNLWAKRLFYESSARVPMILLGAAGDGRVAAGKADNRLVGLADVMPTLLELAGVPVPEDVEGLSMVGSAERRMLYGEFGVGSDATRMITDSRHKLIYYAAGNHRQLFDLARDPNELTDLANSAEHQGILGELTGRLLDELHGSDTSWLADGDLVGTAAPAEFPSNDRGLHGVRGIQWPPPPLDRTPERVVGAPDAAGPA
ncbi:MAG TPA: sulfatase-like hydrolase/transferase [Trebonia sp.]|nr:sulfatase-like hydrolase/transferase [Trebonia sp.]